MEYSPQMEGTRILHKRRKWGEPSEFGWRQEYRGKIIEELGLHEDLSDADQDEIQRETDIIQI